MQVVALQSLDTQGLLEHLVSASYSLCYDHPWTLCSGTNPSHDAAIAVSGGTGMHGVLS